MALMQWVNLSKLDVFKDSDIDSTDRCGKISIEVEVEKADSAISYKAKITPVGSDNVTYNVKELGRNPNFKMEKGNVGIVDTKKLRIDDIKLPAAGGNKYKVEVVDAGGNVVSSSVEVETKRKLFYQFMHMEDASDKVKPYKLTQLENHCKNYHIALTKAGSDKKIPFHKTINATPSGTYNHQHFASDVKKQYDLDTAQKRVGCVTVLSNYIASFKPSKIPILVHKLGGPSNPNCVVSATTVTINTNELLWYGLDDQDDLIKRWFVYGKVRYSSTTGSVTDISIDRKDVSVTGSKYDTYGGYKKIEIKISPALKALLAKTKGELMFAIKINKTAGFSGGFSWGGGGFALTTCNTKSWWGDNTPSNSDVIWNHELGHRMGMVAYGDKDHSATNTRFYKNTKLPDSPSTLYGENTGVNDKGHQGPHCEKGVKYNATTNEWSGTPGCVMFGATGTSTASSPKAYCKECTDITKKLDLSF